MAKPISRAEFRRRKKRKVIMIRAAFFTVCAVIIGLLIWGGISLYRYLFMHVELGTLSIAGNRVVSADLIDVNEYSRPGTRLNKKNVNGIVIHSADTAGVTAAERRNYYQFLKTSGTNHLSCHFVVGLDGEIKQCIPVTEIAYASGSRNGDTIALEYCFEESDGSLNSETYSALVELTAALVNRFELTSDEIYRHTDITENPVVCAEYFEDEENWQKFKSDVFYRAAQLGAK